MNKKRLSIALTLIMILQLAFPIGSIIYYTAFEKNAAERGEIFKMELTGVEYIESTVSVTGYKYDYTLFSDPFKVEYVQVTQGEDGFAKYEPSEKRPKTNSYLKSQNSSYRYFYFPFTVIETPIYENLALVEFMLGEHESDLFDGYCYASEIYLEAKIYKGKIIPLDIYIDGMSINDVLSVLNEQA